MDVMNDSDEARAAGPDGPDGPARSGAGVRDIGLDGRGPARRGRRGPLLITAGFLLVTAVGTAGALGLGGGADDGAGTPGRSSEVVRVTRATLRDQTEIDGELGHGPEVPFPVKAQGTVTWLPATGRTVRRGEAVLRVDDRPVLLMYGSLPMYRELRVPEASAEATPETSDSSPGPASDTGKGASAESGGTAAPSSPVHTADPAPVHGMDVKQFEANLSTLGYSGFTVDQTYTELTAHAVQRWQRDLGLPQTGRVGIGDVVYAPGPVRVAGTDVRVGDSVTASPVRYTSSSRMVTVNARASETNWAQRGSKVTVDLPDGRSVRGTVASVGSDASAGKSGDKGSGGSGAESGSDTGADSGGTSATVTVVITFTDQESLGRLQSGPVTVRYVTRQRENVLTVPVAALTALAEGGYGIEPADTEGGGHAEGTGKYVPVKVGLFADGRAEVSGSGVREGMKVRIPK